MWGGESGLEKGGKRIRKGRKVCEKPLREEGRERAG